MGIIFQFMLLYLCFVYYEYEQVVYKQIDDYGFQKLDRLSNLFSYKYLPLCSFETRSQQKHHKRRCEHGDGSNLGKSTH